MTSKGHRHGDPPPECGQEGPGSIRHRPRPEEAEAPAQRPAPQPRPAAPPAGSEPRPPSGRRPEHLLDHRQPDNRLIVDLLKFHHQRASGLSRYLQETLSATHLHPTARPFRPHGKRLKSLKTRSKICSGYSSIHYAKRSGQTSRSVKEVSVLPKGFK